IILLGILSFLSSMSFAYSVSIKNNTEHLYSYMYGAPLFGELYDVDKLFIHPGETVLINAELLLPSPSNAVTIYKEKSGSFERKDYEYSVRFFEYPSYDFVSFQLDSNLRILSMNGSSGYNLSSDLNFSGDYNSSKLKLQIDSISGLFSDVLRYEFFSFNGGMMSKASGEIFSGAMYK
ncbi:hypothetical protein, partial [Aeromonas salmonicida]|uniref:hypothetical protein n=1 Tax=Aeromonas salmonicida TaxID=645 RepID=UPI00223F4274